LQQNNLGNNVLIASNVQIYTAAHPVELADRLTPDRHEGSPQYFCRTFALPVAIEDGCWIGGGVIIVPGVTIGKGSVIGAGSVVTKDIPANSLAVGNPCRVIRKLNKE
jgi:acetyltransferase-like isoleucine patch superfamily enzyme